MGISSNLEIFHGRRVVLPRSSWEAATVFCKQIQTAMIEKTGKERVRCRMRKQKKTWGLKVTRREEREERGLGQEVRGGSEATWQRGNNSACRVTGDSRNHLTQSHTYTQTHIHVPKDSSLFVSFIHTHTHTQSHTLTVIGISLQFDFILKSRHLAFPLLTASWYTHDRLCAVHRLIRVTKRSELIE